MGYITPHFDMELIRATEKVKEAYTDNELKILFQRPSKNCNFCEFRNWVLVKYLFATGQRVRTVVNIKNKDVDLDNHMILIATAKNRKQKLFPLSENIVPVLREYMKKRKGDSEDYLFCNMYGEQLTRNGLQEAIRKYNIGRGVMKTSIHLFRHTFARKVVFNRCRCFRIKRNVRTQIHYSKFRLLRPI